MKAVESARTTVSAARRSLERLSYDTSELGTAELESLRRMVDGWNVMMRGQPTYERALDVLKVIEDAGMAPGCSTYRILIDKSPDYDIARTWVRKMQLEGIQLDVERTQTSSLSRRLTRRPVSGSTMRSVGIKPDLATYNTLILKAPDYATARTWIDEMQAHGVKPDVNTHRALIGKGVVPHR